MELVGVGTLTISPKYGDKVISASEYDGAFKVYKVADYDASGVFTATNEFHFDGYEKRLTTEYLVDSERFKETTSVVTAWDSEHSEMEPLISGVKAGVKNSLAYGLYLIEQDQSSSSYNDTTPFLVMIPSYTDDKTETNVTAYPKLTKPGTPTTPTHYCKVALGKSDAETGTPLKGVVFNLYKKSGDVWTVIGTYTTDKDGIVYVDHLSYGDYYWQETQALDGYNLDDTARGFVINCEDLLQMVMTNTKAPETPAVPEEIGGFTGDESNMVLYGATLI